MGGKALGTVYLSVRFFTDLFDAAVVCDGTYLGWMEGIVVGWEVVVLCRSRSVG